MLIMGHFVNAILVLFVLHVTFAAKTHRQTQVTTEDRFKAAFDVFWNVPTFMCKNKFDIDFEPVVSSFGIKINKNDNFRGEKILILYEPGEWPLYTKSDTGVFKELNGGIPQKGNLQKHLAEFEKVMKNRNVVPENFSGVGVIDFEAWRPNYRQHWRDQTIYREKSKELVREQHKDWSDKEVTAQAKIEFETAARKFMEETLKVAKRLYPKASWGYYGFPYCLNYKVITECSDLVKAENDEIKWLYEASKAYHLSLYSNQSFTGQNLKDFVRARMVEATRMAKAVSGTNSAVIYPYVWYRYNDVKKFMKEEDIRSVLKEVRSFDMGGAIIWGSSNDVRTREDCQALLNYLTNTLGPVIQRVRNSSGSNEGRRSIPKRI